MAHPFVIVYGGGTEGGAPAHLLHLLRHVDRSQFQPVFVSLGRDRLGPAVGGLGIPYVVAARPGDLAAAARRVGARFLHTHGVRANVLGRLVGRSLGLPVLTTVHSVLWFDYDAWIPRVLAYTAERATQGLTAHFIAISRAIRQHLERRGVPARKVSVVHNGIPPAPPGDRESLRRSLHIPTDVVALVTVARLHPTKGLHHLLAAAALLPADLPPWHLYICGDGPMRAALEHQARALSVADRIRFLGHVPEARRLLAAFDLFVLPSLMEGMGIAALEAMAAGLPVVATAVGGIPELVVDGQTGRLVPPADPAALAGALASLLRSPGQARAMGEAGRRRFADHFTVERFARATEAVYQEHGLRPVRRS